MAALEILPGWSIPDEELATRAVRSGGPGGQNVNKLATKVEVRFSAADSSVLTAGQKDRLWRRFPSQVNSEGELLVVSDATRSQEQNKKDALERLRQMVLSVRLPPKPRVRTRPSRTQKRKRLEEKRRRGEVKKLRGKLD